MRLGRVGFALAYYLRASNTALWNGQVIHTVDNPGQFWLRYLDGQFQLTYARLVTGTSELTYTVESSTDLRSWSPAAGTETGTTPVLNLPGYEWATFQPTTGLPTNRTGFFRIKSVMP